MIGWGKKDDGFEWHKYVRTTILVRRGQRRQKLDDAKQAAVDGMKVAGEGLKDAGLRGADAGAQAAEKGARAAGQGLKSAGSGTLAGLDWLGEKSGRFLAAAAVFISRAARSSLDIGTKWYHWTGDRLGVAIDSAICQRIVLPLCVIGLAAVSGCVFITYLSGFDLEAFVAALIGTLSLAIGGAGYVRNSPRVAKSGRKKGKKSKKAPPSLRGKAASVLGSVRSSLPTMPDINIPYARQAGGGVVVLAVLGVFGLAAGMLSTTSFNFSNLIATVPSIQREPVSGRGRVVWGDTLRIGKKIIRLSGIEAPERGQRCSRPGSRRWRCGPAARSALRRLVGRRSVTCHVGKRDASNRFVGDCRVGEKNIAAELVRRGYVFAQHGMFATYRAEEKIAQDKKIGLWRGSDQQRPEDYRAQKWKEASRKAPDGCPIKGRVLRSGRVYLLPWSDRYRRTKVRQRRGERWFCSEDDAVAAGWRPSDSS